MPRAVIFYVRIIDRINYIIGRGAMYLVFALVAILLWSSFSKTFLTPTLWTLETAQFIMVAYYIMGGPYAIQMGSNVRMDLFYGGWSPVTKAWVDAFTVFCLLFYLGVLIYGAVGSTAYSLGYFGMDPFAYFGELVITLFTEGFEGVGQKLGFLERSSTAWQPYLWPIKFLLCFGLCLMILQVAAEFFRDLGRIRGIDI